MKTRIFSAITLIACLFALVAKGQTPQGAQTSSLPAFLPIGSQQRLWDWAATNRNSSVALFLFYTNNADQRIQVDCGFYSDAYRFASYSAFKLFGATNAWNYYNQFKSDMKPGTPLRYSLWLHYLSVSQIGLNIETNLGTAALVTSNSFWNVVPSFCQAVVTVTNLQRFTIQMDVGDGQTYEYVWTPSVSYSKSFVPPFPNELTSQNLLVLNEWYSVAASRARFSVANTMQTNTYTQYGELLEPKRLSISRSTLQIPLVRGSDTKIMSSADSLNWSQLAYYPSTLGITNAIIPLTPNLPRQLYRAVSW